MNTLSKPAQNSFTVMTEMVLPNDTNALHNLMGGRLMHLMDICAAVAAQRHAHRTVVTASVDNVSFAEPVRLGNIITLEAKVTRAFTTSVEVVVNVFAQDITSAGEQIKTNSAFLTFVAVDGTGRPVKMPMVTPETDDEQKLYEGALRRRQLRLVLAGRMKPAEATELRAIFGE